MTPQIYQVHINGEVRTVLSFLSMEEVFSAGLSGSAIVGHVIDPSKPLLTNNVKVNPAFLTLFHKVVQDTSIELEDFKNEAMRQGNGYVYIIDHRDRHYPNTRSYDIIGAFPIEKGKATHQSYQPNPNYQILSEDGLFRLPEPYNQKLLAAMRT